MRLHASEVKAESERRFNGFALILNESGARSYTARFISSITQALFGAASLA